LPERQQFFRFAYFILDDRPSMSTEGGVMRQTEDAQ
jgi:hypothetical protein